MTGFIVKLKLLLIMTTAKKTAAVTIAIERVYERSPQALGRAFLVDGLWPRGLRKSDLAGVTWSPEVAPSRELRQWFDHRADRWPAFRQRYELELRARPEAWEPLRAALHDGPITLLFAARDTEHNNAIVLRDFLRRRTHRSAAPPRQGRAVVPRRSGSTPGSVDGSSPQLPGRRGKP